MANYNKSFNFRNGVQVDSDNFIVNSTGLVGIGTSIPVRYLDVHGNSALRGQTDVIGITSTSNLRVAGIATFHGDVGIGTTNPTGNALVGNTKVLNVGVVTANYFFGSGLYMDDIVGFTTEGWVVHQAEGSGTVRSGIATHLKVGIGTTEANNTYNLMIGQNPTTAGLEGIGFIGETGDTSGYGNQIIASGQIKANSFVGIGTELTQLNASYLATGTISNNRLPVIDNSKFPTTTIIDSGNGTLQAKFVNLDASVGAVTAGIFTGTSSKFYGQHIGNVTGNADTATTLVSNANVKTSGTLDAVNQVGAAASFSDSLGIQTSSPNGELHIVAKTGAATAQITSPDQASQLVLGLNAAVHNSNNAFIQYGNRSASFPYSQPAALDFINFSSGTHQGNMNFYSDGANAGVNTGSFYWHTNGTTRLMALTYEGNLGIGVTNPQQKLEVNGIGTFASSLYVGGDLEIKNELRVVTGVVTATGFIGGHYGDVDSVSVGCTNLNVTGVNTSPYINCGIGGTIIIGDPTNLPIGYRLQDSPALVVCDGSGDDIAGSFFADDGYLGICTNTNQSDSLVPGGTGLCVAKGAIFQSFVGMGTLAPKAALDLSALGRISDRMMILPKLTTTQRNALSVGNTHDGALVYNISLDRLEFYNGTNWRQIDDSAI
tara:strand:- start:1706 stop:3682 length:1977 start_codon:yes stop_codon:yes gene_type:complete